MPKFISLLLLGSIGFFILLFNTSFMQKRSLLHSIKVVLEGLVYYFPTDFENMFLVVYKEAKLSWLLWFYGALSCCIGGFSVIHIVENFRYIIQSEPHTAISIGADEDISCFAALVSRLHVLIDPTNPLSYRGGCVSPMQRVVLYSGIMVPFLAYTSTILSDEEATYSHKVSTALAMMLMVVGYFTMAMVILSHGITVKERVPSLAVREDSDHGTHVCEVCQKGWLLQDHHCGGFGTCVHKKNRHWYFLCCLCGSLSFGLFFNTLTVYFLRNWHFTSFADVISPLLSGELNEHWRQSLYAIVMPCFVLYGVGALGVFLGLCTVQQAAFLMFEWLVRKEFGQTSSQARHRSKMAAWIRGFVVVAYSPVEVRRFEKDLINDCKASGSASSFTA